MYCFWDCVGVVDLGISLYRLYGLVEGLSTGVRGPSTTRPVEGVLAGREITGAGRLSLVVDSLVAGHDGLTVWRGCSPEFLGTSATTGAVGLVTGRVVTVEGWLSLTVVSLVTGRASRVGLTG